jgi:hypothetical protein
MTKEADSSDGCLPQRQHILGQASSLNVCLQETTCHGGAHEAVNTQEQSSHVQLHLVQATCWKLPKCATVHTKQECSSLPVRQYTLAGKIPKRAKQAVHDTNSCAQFP